MYDAKNLSQVKLPEAKAVVGKRGSLTLTGEFTEAGISTNGVFVKFKLDERWGFPPNFEMVMDLDPFEVEEEK
jgi:hypothetical protein